MRARTVTIALVCRSLGLAGLMLRAIVALEAVVERLFGQVLGL
jgi:hypothetical protein